MKTAVISERLLELISERTVKAALFTTYTFEPDFFELEVIPLLLDQNIGYSQDERVKRFMVRENLREAELPIDVYYDSLMFRRSGDCSPEMEYLCHGVNLGNRAFHAKVNMILLKDRNTNEHSLLLGAGSNNLTRSGWWDNIECQHWEEIKSGTARRKFINTVKDDIAFLRQNRATSARHQSSAIDLIDQFLSTCKGSNSAPQVHYYGLSSKQKYGSFFSFIRQIQSSNFQQREWDLEIISPFFANDVENKEHEKFFDLGVREIALLLPIDKVDKEKIALCENEYYENIRREEKIRWAEWEEETGNSIGLNGEKSNRRLHAKIFHFFNGQQSWIFTGSINFTYRALHENVEAGFLVHLDKLRSLLKPITEDSEIDKFSDSIEEIPGNSVSEEQSAIPELHLCFDWVSKQLVGRTAPDNRYEIEILNAENDLVIRPWEVCYRESEYGGKTIKLQVLLKNGSLVKVRGRDLEKKDQPKFAAHSVLLQQVGWSHKPLDLPNLTASQILAIYAGMSLERRQLMLIDAKVRELVLNAHGGELSFHVDDQKIEQFFCEYAEIFSAFEKLKKLLNQALNNDQLNQVDYYLTGTGVDSMPTLINRTLAADCENQRLNNVTCYLILLSAKEIYSDKKFASQPNVRKERNKLLRRIRKMKSGDRLILEKNSQGNRMKFFKWYESEFFKHYTATEDR